ncbi:MAG: hypothetical protein EXR10_11920 [Alphaproteobacteria bacterium]|nr:hypothetical protein [Alphaproteobacteria bacterium]
MSDASDYCEKAFKTTMSLDSFQKIAQRSCRDPFWATAEGRDRSEIPFTNILSIVFSTIEDRDRFIIAMRFASGEKIPANNESPTSKDMPVRAASKTSRQDVAA